MHIFSSRTDRKNKTIEIELVYEEHDDGRGGVRIGENMWLAAVDGDELIPLLVIRSDGQLENVPGARSALTARGFNTEKMIFHTDGRWTITAGKAIKPV